MQRIDLKLGKRGYPILIGPGLLGSRELLTEHAPAGKLLVVTDEVVAPLWLPRLEQGLAGRAFAKCVLPGGEEQKTLFNVAAIIDALVAARLNRDGMVLALGGGVIGDIAGFAAASYQRGIAFVQLPTTLLAQVDSAVGGKTGVNHPGGKNLIGAFHQPSAVITDTDTLSTLPDRQLRAGIAEIVKAALIADAAFFSWLEANAAALLARDAGALEHAIRRACESRRRSSPRTSASKGGARSSTSATPSATRSRRAPATAPCCTARRSRRDSCSPRSCPRAPVACLAPTRAASAKSSPLPACPSTRRGSAPRACSS
jgi:3-dehydroquinate synthase